MLARLTCFWVIQARGLDDLMTVTRKSSNNIIGSDSQQGGGAMAPPITVRNYSIDDHALPTTQSYILVDRIAPNAAASFDKRTEELTECD